MNLARNKNQNRIQRLAYSNLEQRQLLAAVNEFYGPLPALNHYFAADALQEQIARDHLESQAATSQLTSGSSELELVEIKHGLASHVTRFQQTISGIPVADAYVSTIQGPRGEFVMTHNQGFDELNTNARELVLNFADAERLALEFAGAERTFAESRGKLVWLPLSENTAQQAWQVTVFGVTADNDHGDFLTFVDPTTGKIISQENRIANFQDGQGEVYFPNPYQEQGSGENVADGNDANNTTLEDLRISVTLQGLDEGTGLLKGEFVDLATLDGEFDVDADESTRVYNYTRDDKRFEQVVIYHTVDQINRYFHSLGFDDDTGVANGIRDFPTLASAHWYDQDQSFYSSGDDAIHFGDGGVDDGEDGDIIAHEYGHAVQFNQNASWGGGEMGAMGEGFGDYLAASFFQTHGDEAFQELHAPAVGEWDATSYSSDDPPNLRRVDGNKTYADVGQGVHADGEIWSRALWDINQDIGAAKADQLVLEAHFLMPADSSMVDGAEAILLADQNIFGGGHEASIRASFVARGILPAQADTFGIVTVDSGVYEVDDPVTVMVQDSNAATPVQVTITTSRGDSETLTLTGSSPTFTSTIATMGGAISTDDGSLQVVRGDTLLASYLDTNDGSGGSFTTTAFANIGTPGTVGTDADDQISEAPTAIIGSQIGTIDVETDVDLWHVSGFAGDTIEIDIDIAGEDLDSYLRLFDADGNELAVSDDDEGPGAEPHNRESYLSYMITVEGDYYIGVSAFNNATYDPNSGGGDIPGSTLGDYELIVDVFDADDQIGEALVAPLGSTMAEITHGADVDMWHVTLAAGQQVDIDIDVAGQDLDSLLRLFDSAGTQLAASDDDVGLGAEPHIRESFISFTAPSAGTYYFGVSSYNNVGYDPSTGSGDSTGQTIGSYELIVGISTPLDPSIVGQQIFYNGSSFDTSGDGDAASGKVALLPGQTATFANYSSYSKGINGMMLEVKDLATVPTTGNIGDFFQFRVGNEDNVSGWASAPDPTGVSFQADVDANGTDRIFVTWADNAIQNQWLEVTSLANATTGLAAPSTFYFGNAIGETGNDAGNAQINLIDVGLARANQTGFDAATIDNAFDFDRDGRVNLVDVAIARSNQSGFTSLQLITPNDSGSRSSSSSVAGDTKGDGLQNFSAIPQFDFNRKSNLDVAFESMTRLESLDHNLDLTCSVAVLETPETETVERELDSKQAEFSTDAIMADFDAWI